MVTLLMTYNQITPNHPYFSFWVFFHISEKAVSSNFYSARNAGIASAVLATAIPSVCLSVCLSVSPSVRHTPVLCQNDGT